MADARSDRRVRRSNGRTTSGRAAAYVGRRSTALVHTGKRLASLAALVGRRWIAISVKSAGAGSLSITTRIQILVAIAVLPLLAFAAFLVVHDAEGSRAKQLQQFDAATRVMSQAIDAEIERQLAVAFTLRNALASKELNLRDFYNLALATVADVPDLRIYLYDKTGRMLATSMLPFGAELPLATAPKIIQRVVDTKLPYVSDLVRGPVTRSYVTQVFVPVIVDGVVSSVVTIGYPPSRISSALRERTQDAIGVVFDRTGRIIARTRNEAQFLGQSVVPDLIAAASAAQEGVFVTNTLEGIPIRGTFIKSAGSGWTTALAIPWGEVNAPLVNALALLGGGGSILIIAATLTTFFYGRSIAQPLIRLSEMADSLGRGEPLPHRRFSIKEAQEISDRLRSSAEELNRRNAALLGQTAALNAANRELEGFSYSMSHVLRAPLRAIDGYSQILLEDHCGSLDNEGMRLIGALRANSLAINQQIDGILEFLRLGHAAIHLDRIDMAAVVRMALEGLAPDTRGSRSKFQIAPLPEASGDAAMIGRVWTNLLDNAMKFTASKANARIEVGAASDNCETVYHIRDNGVGFDQRYADKLFGVFSRLHGDDYSGDGMGLAIVRRVISRHGGRVWAKGKVGEGASFYFTLPVPGSAHV